MLRPRLGPGGGGPRPYGLLLSLLLVAPAAAQDKKPFTPRQPIYSTTQRAVWIWDAQGQRRVGTDLPVRDLAVTPDGKRIVAGTDDYVHFIDPDQGRVVGRLDLARGLTNTQAQIQSLAFSGDGKRLWIVLRFRSQGPMGYDHGAPLLVGHTLRKDGLPELEPSWRGLVPDGRRVDSLFAGAKADDPVLLFHAADLAFTRADPKRDPLEDFEAFRVDSVPGKSLRVLPGAHRLRPARTASGSVLVPLAASPTTSTICRYTPTNPKGSLFSNKRYPGASAQCLATTRKETLLYLGSSRLRVLKLEPTVESKASFHISPPIQDMALSADGKELYLARGDRITVLHARTLRTLAEVEAKQALRLVVGPAS